MMGVYPHSGITNQPNEITTGTAVHKQLAAKRKPFWTTQRCRPERYINRDKQSERVSGTDVYRQRSAKQTPSGTAAPAMKAKYNWPSRITTRTKAKALLYDTAVLTRAVYLPRSAKRKHIYQSGISTAISNSQASLALPYINHDQRSESTSPTAGPMMDVYPHSGITNQQSENTTGTAVY